LGFIFSCGEEDGFAGVEDGSDSHGDDMEWHRVFAPEEAGVVLAGAGGKGFDARAGGEGGCRLVEANVAVSADAEELEVDAACCADFFLVATAEFFWVLCHTVWDMDVCQIDVHMPKEVLVHEGVVGLRVVSSDTDVFVQIERVDLRPIEVLLDELFVEWHGCSACGEAENRIQIAILLDTSSSMDGLIDQAKTQLWKVVNTFIEAKHDRITSMHVKDRQTPANGAGNLEWGKGDTPLKEILTMMRDKKYKFPASVELEYTVPEGSNAVKEVAKCVAYAKKLLME
jgi:hypothetical protein